jgi:hypothetical protein
MQNQIIVTSGATSGVIPRRNQAHHISLQLAVAKEAFNRRNDKQGNTHLRLHSPYNQSSRMDLSQVSV